MGFIYRKRGEGYYLILNTNFTLIYTFDTDYLFFNPLTATLFLDIIRGQSVTQRSMGREAWVPISVSRSIKRSNFHDEITR